MIEQWRKQLQEPSGNLTTNEVMPQELADKLLEEDISLKGKLSFTEVSFPEFGGTLGSIPGLHILAGLQRRTKQDCLTLFRAVRFPTYKRVHEMVFQHGYSILNYEQERILELYQNKEYFQKRDEIKKDRHFQTQPQERVVRGLPLFSLVNDALQIHYAFRGEQDKVAMVAVHIPSQLLETKQVTLVANAAIDLDYGNADRDIEINDFIKSDNSYRINYGALRVRGVDLHEMYSPNLPLDPEQAKAKGIEQEFFLLDINRIDDTEIIKLSSNIKILRENEYFLHGFFGDQNIFARRQAKHLPQKCWLIKGAA